MTDEKTLVARRRPINLENNASKADPREANEEAIERPSPRAEPPKSLSPREEAEAYAAMLRANQDAVGVVADDPLDVSHLQPEGWTYAWHTYSVFYEVQSKNIQKSRQRGWRFVPRTRHPELMPHDSTEEWIMDHGLVLVELPTVMVEQYQAENNALARDQIRAKEQSLSGAPAGTLPRTEDARTAPKIKKSFEAAPIPD